MFRLTLLVIFSLFIHVSCGSLGKDTKERAQLHLRIGTSHLTQGNYPAALNELLIAASLDPQNPVIQNNLGLAYFVRGKRKKAEIHIKKALVLEPKYTDARNNLGRVLIDRGLYSEAARELESASKDLTFPYPFKVQANLGVAYFKLKEFDKAYETLKKSLKLNRKSCRTMNYYGRALFELKKYVKASSAFDQAVQLCKGVGFDEPHYYGALSYYQLGDREQAMARLREVVNDYPDGKYLNKAIDLLKMIQ